jgi:micrococcal nuclease
MSLTANSYSYTATVLRIVDGDTAHFCVDLGFDIRVDMSVRFYGINAPEMKLQAGKDARAALTEKLPAGASVVLQTYKDKQEKYGRYLASVFYKGENINDWLVSAGLADFHNY